MTNSSQNSRYLLVTVVFPLFLETVPACTPQTISKYWRRPAIAYLSETRHPKIGMFLEFLRTSRVWVPSAEGGLTVVSLEPLVFSAYASNRYDMGARPVNGPAYPFLEKNESNPNNEYCSRQSRHYE